MRVTPGAAGAPERPRRNAGAPERPRRNAGAPERPRRNAGAPERPRRNAGAPSPSYEAVLQPLPRRPRLAHIDKTRSTLHVRRFRLPSPRPGYILWRALQWSFALAAFAAKRAKDGLAGDRSLARRGQRIRELFEALGGTAIKIGQQMAVRVDFLPFEVCQELGKLMDRVPPFPFKHAVKSIEELAKAPIDEIFEHLDPEPIGSASIACVYRGRLRAGDDVAVKVKRPGVDEVFVADLELVKFATTLAERLALVRPDFFKYLRSELWEMFTDELDFAKEANYQAMFRRYARRDRIRWLTTPRIFAALSSNDVLTTEFITGYPCADVLKAAETEDEDALGVLASSGIDPLVIGQRVLQVGLWSRLECPFFHADPHPGNILILPENGVVMLDFGSCGLMSTKQSAHQREMFRRMLRDDVSGAVSVVLSMLAPLPNIDVAELKKRLEYTTWNHHITVKSKDAEWWERTTARVWINMLEVTREFNLPVNIDVLRLTRATLLYDTLACRLNPAINERNAVRMWSREAAKRARRRAARRARITRGRPVDIVQQQVGMLGETLQKGAFWVNQMSQELPKEFIAAAGKGAFVIASALRFVLTVTLIVSLAVVILLVRQGLADVRIPAPDGVDARIVLDVLGHPVVAVLVAVATLSFARRVRSRLEDKEPQA